MVDRYHQRELRKLPSLPLDPLRLFPGHQDRKGVQSGYASENVRPGCVEWTVSVYRAIVMGKLSHYLSLSSNSFASTALDWGISSLWRFRSLVLLARPSCANMNQRRSIPKLYNALFTLFWHQLEPAFDFHVHEAFRKERH